MTVVDFIVVGVVVLSGMIATGLGLVRVVLGLGGWIGAGLATLYGFKYARPFAHHLSWSLRSAFEKWGNIDGYDSALNPMQPSMTASADPDLRAGERLDLAVGINYIIPAEKTNRLALEIIKPVYQYLDGPQLETDLAVVLGWQMSQ